MTYWMKNLKRTMDMLSSSMQQKKQMELWRKVRNGQEFGHEGILIRRTELLLTRSLWVMLLSMMWILDMMKKKLSCTI